MSELTIRIEHAGFTRDRFIVLNDVSADFPAGRCTLIVGPSGSGKSTLLKIAAGLFPPDHGRVTCGGIDITAASGEQERVLRCKLGFVFQDAALWQNMSVYQNLALPLRYHHPRMSDAEIRTRIDRLTGSFPIRRQFDLRPAALSAGENKIVSFLRALVLEPEVLFFDEPTSSVDHRSAERIVGVLAAMGRSGTTLIGISHNAQLTARLADNLVVLIDGAVRTYGTVAHVAAVDDREVQNTLSEVLADAASFDGDILKLLDDRDPQG